MHLKSWKASRTETRAGTVFEEHIDEDLSKLAIVSRSTINWKLSKYKENHIMVRHIMVKCWVNHSLSHHLTRMSSPEQIFTYVGHHYCYVPHKCFQSFASRILCRHISLWGSVFQEPAFALSEFPVHLGCASLTAPLSMVPGVKCSVPHTPGQAFHWEVGRYVGSWLRTWALETDRYACSPPSSPLSHHIICFGAFVSPNAQ